MGFLSKFKTLLKTSSLHRREEDDDGNCLTHVRPASATTPRVVTATAENENSRPATPQLGNGSSGSPAPTRTESMRMAVPRIDSVTTKAMGGSRFETTIITRQGSRLVLQGVKTMKPDSDDEAEDESEPVAASPPPAASASSSTPLRHGASASGSPHPYPSASGSPAGGSTLPSAHATPHPPASTANPGAPIRRKPNRVASLPMLLDGGMPRAPRPIVDEAAPAPEYSGPQEPEPKQRRPPKRTESLKYLLHLDQYRFNQDVSVQEAREAACGMAPAPTPQGSLEDIISADGTTTSILAVSAALPARMRRPRWSLEDYQLLKQLHRGYASDVYQARCRISGEMVALKVYKLAEQGDIQRMQLYREIKLHAKLRHSNIVQYYACFLEQQRVILVTEFATGGDLLRIMYKCGGRLFERQAVNLVLQPFLAALHYLHTQGIVHRDIKPENVLFAEGKILKLADFGLAINLKEERANTRAGTLDYMAPEVLRCPTKKTPDENKGNPQSAHYHQAVDAWAVGVFAYELIVGAPPFKAGQMIDTARNIMHAPVCFPDTVSDLAKDFITRALHKDCMERLTVLDMLHHPWITMFQRRSSVRIVYTRSNSLMELMQPEGRAGGGGGGGGGGAAGGRGGGGDDDADADGGGHASGGHASGGHPSVNRRPLTPTPPARGPLPRSAEHERYEDHGGHQRSGGFASHPTGGAASMGTRRTVPPQLGGATGELAASSSGAASSTSSPRGSEALSGRPRSRMGMM